jgi:hypothetical protein
MSDLDGAAVAASLDPAQGQAALGYRSPQAATYVKPAFAPIQARLA